MPDPLVSVIIPSYNRPRQLLDVLDALAHQTFPSDRTEVIVVDDGSQLSYERIERSHWPFQLRYLRQENCGGIVARQFGVERACGEFIVFLEDDIYAEPEYLMEMALFHHQYPRDILLCVLHNYLPPNPTLFQQAFATYPDHVQDEEVSYADCSSWMIGLSKSVYQNIGGLRPLGMDGRSAWGGVEFAYRASKAGYKIRRCGKALAYHDDSALRNLSSMRERGFHAARMAVLSLQHHPEFLAQIPMFRDKTPIRWGDSPALIRKKIASRILSSGLAIPVMLALVRFLERHTISHRTLSWLYKNIVSASISQGCRAGWKELASRKS